MFSAWGNKMPWGISPFGPSDEILYEAVEYLPIVGKVVDDVSLSGDITNEISIAGTISTEVAL